MKPFKSDGTNQPVKQDAKSLTHLQKVNRGIMIYIMPGW